MFTQRHLVTIAAELESLKPRSGAPATAHAEWVRTVDALAKLFARHNPRFKRELFIRACGI